MPVVGRPASSSALSATRKSTSATPRAEGSFAKVSICFVGRLQQFVEELRRLKIMPNGFGKITALKLKSGALIRAAEHPSPPAPAHVRFRTYFMANEC